MRGRGLLLISLLCLALGLGGCGESSSPSQGTSTAEKRLGAPEPPNGAGALVRSLYRNFQLPSPTPDVPGSAKAIREGEEACKEMTPKQVALRFRYEAELSGPQRAALAQIARAEAHPTADYVAGQLAALAYEGTLEQGPLAEYGYRGCIHELAQELVERLEKRGPQVKIGAQR